MYHYVKSVFSGCVLHPVSSHSTYSPHRCCLARLSLLLLHLPRYLDYGDQILRFNLSAALWTYRCSQTGRVSPGFKKSFALFKTFIHRGQCLSHSVTSLGHLQLRSSA